MPVSLLHTSPEIALRTCGQIGRLKVNLDPWGRYGEGSCCVLVSIFLMQSVLGAAKLAPVI